MFVLKFSAGCSYI